MTWFVQESEMLNFLHDLSVNDALLQEYIANPEKVIDKYGLSDTTKKALLSQDKDEFLNAFTDQLRQVSKFSD